jgi:hypothetical protein
LPKLKNLQ